MSGGSYDYLYGRDADDLSGREDVMHSLWLTGWPNLDMPRMQQRKRNGLSLSTGVA